MYVCMYVCMYVYIYIIFTSLVMLLCYSDIRFLGVQKLIGHRNKCHEDSIEIVVHHFDSLQIFEKWKNEEERRSKSSYVQHSASRMQGVNRKSYLYCHRSGIVRSEGKGLRALKTQGSCKMNEFCTAHMTVTEDTITKKVKVSYCSHHSNHEPEICHMKVPEDVKNIVAAKLAEGVSIDRILDDIRDNVTGSLEREHIMNRQDIHNIQYQLNLESVVKHQNDHTSVSAWVTEMKEMEYNPILIFKNQGEEQGDDVMT